MFDILLRIKYSVLRNLIAKTSFLLHNHLLEPGVQHQLAVRRTTLNINCVQVMKSRSFILNWSLNQKVFGLYENLKIRDDIVASIILYNKVYPIIITITKGLFINVKNQNTNRIIY